MSDASIWSLRKALIEPRAVAVIGACDCAARTIGRPLALLRRHGFGGLEAAVDGRVVRAAPQR